MALQVHPERINTSFGTTLVKTNIFILKLLKMFPKLLSYYFKIINKKFFKCVQANNFENTHCTPPENKSKSRNSRCTRCPGLPKNKKLQESGLGYAPG